MTMNENEKLKAAYALNLCTVSVSQIVDYNDVNILEQEYETIINNLNLERMPKDAALLNIMKEIMDEITYSRMEEGDRKIMERRYQHQLANAVWSAVPNVATIFANNNPLAMGLTLATQVGIGYMNYRRKKAEDERGYEESKWQIAKNRMRHFNGLQKELFGTAWRLAEVYEFPDRYRLTDKEISLYNKALMEPSPVKRYNKLDAIKSDFEAYPVFWYQFGSTANSIFRSNLYELKPDLKCKYKALAIANFEKFYQLNKFNLLKHDLLTASCLLEYLELLDLTQDNNLDKAKEMIREAKKHAGNALDVIELCAFAYLKIGDYDNAVKAFHQLVNNGYNSAINTQILSALYIKRIYEGDQKQKKEAQMGYDELPNIADEMYILPFPPKGVDLSEWKPQWKQDEKSTNGLSERLEEEKRKKEEQEERRKKALPFYRQSILLVYPPTESKIAEYFKGVLDEDRKKLGDHTLPYARKLELKEYKKRSEEFEKNGTHIIMLGDSDEAKKMYKIYLKMKGDRWDCSNECYDLGMRYISYGTKTILLVRQLKDEQIDSLVHFADGIKKNQPIPIPEGVESVKYTAIEECYQGLFEKSENWASDLLAAVYTTPWAVLAQAGELIQNGVQWGKNLNASNELKFLQYCVAIYKYLESNNAIID